MNTKDFIKREWILWIAIIAPLIFALVRWNDFPEQVPTHWNASGEIDDYSGKWAVFLSPVINLVLYFLLIFIPRLDPRKKNYELFSGAYFMIRCALAIFMSLIGIVTLLATLKYNVNVGLIVILAVLGLFLLMGNQFGRIRTNYFVGLRTPWTLSNEEVWTKTHRLAGRIWVAGSLLMMILVWFIPMKIFAILFIPYLIVITVVPVVYSYTLHKKIVAQNQTTDHH